MKMKCRPEQMVVFVLDYGDLTRPPYQILRSRGWAQCPNNTAEAVIVYGPKHEAERSIFDTSPYVLPPGATTPDKWDCKGFFLPLDRELRLSLGARPGPLAIKFWNFRRFSVSSVSARTYQCSWHNGMFQPSEINWAIPNFTYQDVCARLQQCD